MRQPTVAQLMTKNPVVVGPYTSFKAIAHLLLEHRIGAVAVVDAADAPIAVVAESDLVASGNRPAGRRWPWRRQEPVAVRAMDLMTTPADTISGDAPYAVAAREMCRTGRRRLYVVDSDDRLIGVVSPRGSVAPLCPHGRGNPAERGA